MFGLNPQKATPGGSDQLQLRDAHPFLEDLGEAGMVRENLVPASECSAGR